MTRTEIRVTKSMRAILLGLPGYDPFAQAGECEFDSAAARTALEFFPEMLRHVKGAMAGEPFALERWQQSIIANLFGWRREDGTRRYRECLIYVPKKNGKTALAAGLMIYMLACDGEKGAENYSAASSRDQAALVFAHAAGMVRQEPELKRRLKVYGDKGGSIMRSIVHQTSMSSYKCLAADANTADGFNPHFVIVDEVHRHKSPELAEVLQKSTAARRQPLVIYTTTADYNRPSLCNSKLAYARSVRNNKGDEDVVGFDPSFLPVVYEASKDDDWRSPETWRNANPNLGVTITEEFLARECRKAQETPTELNNFLRLHLNIVTDAAEAWIPIEKFDSCLEAWDLAALAGRRAYGALDLSSKLDITAWMLLFPPADVDLKWRCLSRFYVPEERIAEREKHDRVPYRMWVAKGFLRTTPGNVVDYDFIKADIVADAGRFEIKEIAYDPWSATQTALQLQGDGFTVVEFRQGFRSLSEPAKEFEKLIASRTFAHDGNPVLRWMMSNTMVEKDPAGNVKPSKSKSTEKIDGIVALVMALGRAMLVSSVASRYETEGIEVI